MFASFFFIIKAVPLSVFRAKEKAGLHTIFAFLALILGLLFNILFVIVFRENVRGILKSALISQFIVFLVILIPFSKNVIFKFKGEYLKRMFTFGLPLVPSGIAMWILTLLDRFFLKYFLTMDIVGVYSLGYKISTIMSMLVVIPFSMAWSPLMLRWYKEKNDVGIYIKAYKYFSIVGFFVALVISLFSKEIIRIMTTPPFYDAYKIVYLIVLAYLFHGFYMIFSAGCTFARKTYYFPIATGIAALTNTVLNIVFIPRFQMMGAAVATIASYFIMTALVYLFSNKYYRIPFNFTHTIKIALITTIIYILGLFIGDSIVSSILLKSILLSCYFPLIYVAGVFSEREKVVLKKAIRKRIKR